MRAHEIRDLNDNSRYPLDKYPLYSRDADRPVSMSNSACSTPRSLNSYTSSATDVSPRRLLIPRDIQSPSHVVAQIRGAHKQLLYLSRNNFVQPGGESEADQASSQSQDWQHGQDQQQDQYSLDRISESSDSNYMPDHSQAGTPHSSTSLPSRAHELQHSNDTLSRQLSTLHSDMQQQQHDHFKMRQEQHLQLEDLRAHVSHLQDQLQDNQDSTNELLSVNTFLDSQLKKHKDQLHTARQSTLRYHRQLQQEQQERDQLNKQLQDTQAQLAEAWQDSSQQQQLVAELHKQATSAAEQEATATQLTTAQDQLATASEELAKVRGELSAANSDKQQLSKARDSLTADLKEVNLQLMGLQSALTEAFQEQDVAVKRARHQLLAQHAQQARAAAEKLSTATQQNQQLAAEVADLQQQLQQAQNSADESGNQKLSEAAQHQQQLETQVAALQQQLQHAQTSADKSVAEKLSEAAQQQQQHETQVFALQQQLQQAQTSAEQSIAEKLSEAAQQQQQHGAQVAELQQQLQQAQSSADEAAAERLTAAHQQQQQLEAQLSGLKQQLEQAYADITEGHDVAAKQEQQLEAQVAELQQQLQQAQQLSTAEQSAAAQHQSDFEAQLASVQQQLEHAQASAASKQSAGTQHSEHLEAQLSKLQQQLEHAEASATAESVSVKERDALCEEELAELHQQLERAVHQQSVSMEEIAQLADRNAQLDRQLQELSLPQQQAQQRQFAPEVAQPMHNAPLDQQQEVTNEVGRAQQEQVHGRSEDSAYLTQHCAQLEQQLQQLQQELQQTQQRDTAAAATDELAQLKQQNAQLERRLAEVSQQLEQAQSEVQRSAQLMQQLDASSRQYVEHAGSLQGQLATLKKAHGAQTDEIEALKVKLEQQAKQGAASQQLTDLQQALRAVSDHDAEQAVAHAKEITQLTEAHTQLQNLVNTLTEENTRLDQANTTRSMHIGSLSAGLDQVKRTKSAKSGSGPDLLPQVSPVDAPVDDRSAELSSELADLQRKQSSRNLQALKSTELSMPSSTDQSAGDVELKLQIDSLKQQVADLQSEQNELKEQLRTAQQSREDEIQGAQEVLQEQHAGQMSVLKTEFECLLEDYTAKDQQVQDLMTKLDKAQHKADKAQQPTPAGKDSDKVTHLTEINRQLEDHVTSLDSQLEQLQQELEAAGAEAVAAAAHTQASLQGSLKAQHAQHETSLAQHRAEVASVQEACSAKDLQVHQLLTEVDQLTDERDQRENQVGRLQAELDYLGDQTNSRVGQVVEQLEALQQEHHGLSEAHLELEKQNRLLQEECTQLQGYISVLDEDLGKAQERIGSALADDDDSAAKQNEMLKAAAKQVCQIQARDAKRSKMPKLLRKFSSRKKDRGSFIIDESVTPKSPAVHPMSPMAGALPPFPAQSRQSEIQRNPSDVSAYPVSPRMGGDAAHFVQTAAGQISIEALQPSLSNVSTEASAEYVKLKEENQSLADKLTQAETAVAELNGRLVDAAFGADTMKTRSVRRSMSGMDHTDASSVMERESSTMAHSNSSDYVSLAGMPPGVPLDPIYD